MSHPRTAVVVPCYDEERRLDRAAFLGFVDAVDDVDFVMVDDGSRDGTAAVLSALASERPGRFEVVSLAENRGKAEAVRAGVLAALAASPAYARVGYWDADLATPLRDIPVFAQELDRQPSLHLVMGARVNLLGRQIERRRIRHVLGRAQATLTSLSLALPVYDAQCGAKLFRVSPLVREIFAEPFVSSWLFDVELLARMGEACGWDVSTLRSWINEHPLRVWADVAGSHVRPATYLRALGDLIRIHWRYRVRGL